MDQDTPFLSRWRNRRLALSDALRRGPLREGAFSSVLHEPRTAVVVGRWLGAALLTCFLTGLFSHLLQEPPPWLRDHLPSRPVDGYQISQGLHVISGIAAIPLLGAKLWAVYPKLFGHELSGSRQNVPPQQNSKLFEFC